MGAERVPDGLSGDGCEFIPGEAAGPGRAVVSQCLSLWGRFGICLGWGPPRYPCRNTRLPRQMVDSQ